MSRGRSGAVVLTALLAPGCAAYVPVSPRAVTAANATTTLERVDLRALSVTVALDAPGAKLANARLTPSGSTAACEGGLAATRVHAEDARRFTIQFPHAEGWKLLEQGAALALTVDDGRAPACVRLPITELGAPVAYRNSGGEDPWWAGEAVRVWIPVGGGSVTSGAQLSFRGGHWLGPVRAGLEAGFGSSFCFSCGRHDVLAVPLAAGLEAFILRFGRGALGVSADYELRPTWRTYDDGERFKWLQGVRGGVELSLNGPGLPQFPEGPKQSHLGFAVEVAHWSAASFEATVIDLAVKLDGPAL